MAATQKSSWSRSPSRIKGGGEFGTIVGCWRTRNKSKTWTVQDSGPASLCICSSSVFPVFLISPLLTPQWLLIPRLWVTRHSHILLKYLVTLDCLFSAAWQLSGLGRQTLNYDSDHQLPHLALFCLWDASHGDWVARLPGPFLRYVTWDMFVPQDYSAQEWC